MRNFMTKIWHDKRGNALIIAAAALPLLIGSAGLATDTIQWALWKRQLQRAADSAARLNVAGPPCNMFRCVIGIIRDCFKTGQRHGYRFVNHSRTRFAHPVLTRWQPDHDPMGEDKHAQSHDENLA